MDASGMDVQHCEDPNEYNPVNRKIMKDLYNETMDFEKKLILAGYNLIYIMGAFE